MYHLFLLNSILYLMVQNWLDRCETDIYNRCYYVITIGFCYIIIKLYGTYILCIKNKMLLFETFVPKIIIFFKYDY